MKNLNPAVGATDNVVLSQMVAARGLPSYAGVAPKGPFDPVMCLYNGKGSNLRKTHAGAMRALQGGTGKLHIGVISDSGAIGFNGTAVVDNNSLSNQMGRVIASQLGVPRAGGYAPCV